MRDLVLEFLTAREVDPATLIGLAARQGIRKVTISLNPFRMRGRDALPFGALPDWDLIGDTPNRREVKRCAQAEGVAIESADVFLITPESDGAACEPALESAAWLGARCVTLVPYDPDPARLMEGVRRFCTLAGSYGLIVTLEHSPRMALRTLAEALDFQRQAQMPNLRILTDCLHFFRAGSTIGDLAGVTADALARIQLCDGLARAPDDPAHEAFYERRAPGEGDFPLAPFLAALPAEIPVGLEVPLWQAQRAGMEPSRRIDRIVRAARALLSTLPA